MKCNQTGDIEVDSMVQKLHQCDEYLAQMKLKEANALLEEIAEAVSSCPDRYRLQYLLKRSICSGRMGDMIAGLGASRDAAILARKLESAKDELSALKFQGNCLFVLGEFSQSLEVYRNALRIANRENEDREIGAIYNNLGAAYIKLNDTAEARTYYELARSLHAAKGRDEEVQGCELNLAICLFREGKLEKAEKAYTELLVRSENLSDTDHFILATWGLADVYAERGKLEIANARYRKLVAKLKENDQRGWLTEALYEWGQYLARAGYANDARPMLEASLEEAESLNLEEFVIKASRELSEILCQDDRIDEAHAHLRRASELETDRLQRMQNERIEALRIMHETERAHYQAEIQRLRNQELRAALGEAESQRSRAEEANRLKSEILHMVAHDLRNPLGGIIGVLDNLNEVPGEEAASMIKMALAEAKSSLDLLNRLLDAAAFEEGRVNLYPEVFPLTHLVSEAVKGTLERDAGNKGQFLSVVEEAAFSQVRADPSLCQQVLSNLFSNAIKYSPFNTTILYGTRQEGDRLVFWIQDPGPGIPQDQLENVFKPFAKLKTSVPTGNERVVGLGLSIAKRTAELQGGTLDAKSDGLGKGSTFIFQLPLVENG